MLIPLDYIALAKSVAGRVVIRFNVSTKTRVIIIINTDHDPRLR